MSTLVMSACWPLQMPPTPKAVLISLADNANDHGECWPSIQTIATRTCFSERAVQNAIRWLESARLVVANRENGRHTRYVLTPAAYAPPQEMRPAAPAPKPPQLLHPPPQEIPKPPQEVPSNHQEPSPRATTKKATPRSSIALPEWLPPEAWADWCDYRRGKTWTPKAQELSIRSLETLRGQGHHPVKVIETAIERGWRGLYAPPPQRAVAATGHPLSKTEEAFLVLEGMKSERSMDPRRNSPRPAEAPRALIGADTGK